MFIRDFISRLHQTSEHVFMLTQMICAWFIQRYAAYFSLIIIGKGQAAERQLLRYLSFGLFWIVLIALATLSIKSQHSLGSVIPPAIVHIAVHAAQCWLNEKKAKSEERERDLQYTISRSRCRVGPRSSPSIRGGVKMREWDGAWGVAVGCLHCTPLLQMDSRGVLRIKHCSLSRNL